MVAKRMTTLDTQRAAELLDMLELACRPGWQLHPKHNHRVKLAGVAGMSGREALRLLAGHDGLDAVRLFEYKGGAKAYLYVSRSADWRREWEAGFRVPFSAGPDASHSARRVSEALHWANRGEKVLSVPLKVEKAASWEQATRMLLGLKNTRPIGWSWMEIVFDCDLSGAGDVAAAEILAERLVPHLDPVRVNR